MRPVQNKPPKDLYSTLALQLFKLVSCMLVLFRVSVAWWYGNVLGDVIYGQTIDALKELAVKIPFIGDTLYMATILAAISQLFGYAIYLVAQIVRDVKGILDGDD